MKVKLASTTSGVNVHILVWTCIWLFITSDPWVQRNFRNCQRHGQYLIANLFISSFLFCIHLMDLLKMTNVIHVRSLIFSFKLRDRIYLAQFYNVTTLYKTSECLLEGVAWKRQDFRLKLGHIYMVWIYHGGLTCRCLLPTGSHLNLSYTLKVFFPRICIVVFEKTFF